MFFLQINDIFVCFSNCVIYIYTNTHNYPLNINSKVALPMFATGSVSGIIDAIDRENVIYLTKFPKVGDKLARRFSNCVIYIYTNTHNYPLNINFNASLI